MKLLKQIIKTVSLRTNLDENGATSAGGIAGGMMPLFSTLVRRANQQATSAIPIIQVGQSKGKKKSRLRLKETFESLQEDADAAGMGDGQSKASRSQSNFDQAEVMSKLKGLEHKERGDNRNSVSFGLEDENGGIVRVTIKADQAEDFEKSLQAFMRDEDEENDKGTPEIAEILFKLKDRFDIVDVKWPDIEEDEEQEVSIQGDEAGVDGAEGDPNAPSDPNGEDDVSLDDTGAAGGEDTGQVQGLLTQVIDMMKADAEARKADAQARQAEAKVKEADAIVAQAMTRVKQEEQYLDMDQYNKSKKDQSKESKRLAQLARWKHDMSRDQGIDSGDDSGGSDMDDFDAPEPQDQQGGRGQQQSNQENEESNFRRPSPTRAHQPSKPGIIRGRVHPHDVANFILNRVK